MKRTLTLLFTIIVILNLCSCTEKMITPTEKSSTTTQTEIQAPATERPKDDTDDSEHSFAIHYIDVGQGDAALVVCDDKTMLIDGGKPSASSTIYTYLKNLNIDYLDYIVVSHADDDHIGGLSAPLAKMNVGNVIAPETEADTRSYNSLKTKTEEQGLAIQHPKPGDSIDLGGSKIEFYGPITESESDRNNGSIVMKIIYGDTSFLFTGDAERYSALYLAKNRTYQAFCNCGKQRFNLFHSVTINVFDLFIKTRQTAENTEQLLIKEKIMI